MKIQVTVASLPLLFYCFLIVGSMDEKNGQDRLTIAQQVPETYTTTTEREKRDGVEEEVLGPLRVWHIVFLVGLVITIGVTVLCCCVEWRIPRTRQEIEETYRRRQLNQKYLHQLERTPDAILRNNNNNNNSSNSNNNSGSNNNNGGHGEDNDVDHTRGVHRPGQQNHHNHHQRTSHHRGAEHDRHPRHPHHGHQQQQQQQQQQKHALAVAAAAAGGGGRGGVAVTEASGRLARIAKSHMYGVQTPFELSAITALQKQRQAQRQAQRQDT